MTKRMTSDEFSQLVGTYGAHPDRWPDEHRAAMQSFLQSHQPALATISREGKLDEWLDRRFNPASDSLQARLMADMQSQLSSLDTNRTTSQPVPLSTRRTFISAAVPLAACFIAGIIFAPDALDLIFGRPDILASIDLFADEFLLN